MQKDELIGTRERDNFLYTRGETSFYDKNCNNSIIISNLEKGVVKGITNHAVINDGRRNYLIPITEIEEILDISSKMLRKKCVLYKKPRSILEIQNLGILSEEEIRQKISSNYNLEIKNLLEIKTKKGRNRVYKIVSKRNKEFMLKYCGKDPELFESQVSFLEGISSFPSFLLTVNSVPYIFFKDNIYALEEFVEGEILPSDKENYFGLVGKHLALMHNEFNKKTISKKNLENVLTKEGNFFSESNLISMQIDLENDYNNEFFLKEMASLPRTLGSIVNSFPDQIIHGDLNRSNLIWNKNNAKTIDSETIIFSKRILDFIPALLFEGNLTIPHYTPNSLRDLIDSYDLHAYQKLREDERTILPYLLKFSLIKSYVIYVLRRNLKDGKFKNQIINNLKLVEGEINVN
ncbi:MAG: phosphotransferase [Nanoarchaeota archaeon]|nr:phosphotransferase [Nanoarchaeota archaeon]